MAKVSITNVSKIYDGKPPVQAVHDVSLEIADQEFLVLVGPSGCGKSTLLRMIAGLEDISSGAIAIGDQVVNDVQPKDRDIAMVFQNYALYPHMTVYKNMAFGLMLRKFPKAEIDQRVREAADILGITPYLDRKPKALSGGQRQRVAVGRAIVRKPKVFLFDEPLSNLDAKMRVQMRTEISKLHQRLQSTMIYVTHDQVEAMTMGDRIVVMRDGVILQVGEPMTIYDTPKNLFVASFIGSPPMNFFHGIIESVEGLRFRETGKNNETAQGFTVGIPDARRARLEMYTGKKVVFGVRPEAFELRDPVSQGNATAVLTATVEVVEPMGSEIYLYLHTAVHSFVARTAVSTRAEPGQKLELALDLPKTHFFDTTTEEALV